MPVLVNPKACLDREHCFAAAACPYDAFLHNPLRKTWEVDANVCGDCPGPCLNFCDQDALRWGDDLVDLTFVKAELEGTMTPTQVAEARLKHKKEVEIAAKARATEAAAAKNGGAQKTSEEGVIAITRRNFEREVLRSQVPVVVDVWADWCAPCKQFAPIFAAMAKQYVGVIKFAKLDSDAEPALSSALGVRALPTLLTFYKGQMAAEPIEGALPAEHFQAYLYQMLIMLRQHQAQFEAEAEDAIKAAVNNLAILDSVPLDAPPTPETNPTTQVAGADTSGLLLGHETHPMESPRNGKAEPPGKQTSSGLYIP